MSELVKNNVTPLMRTNLTRILIYGLSSCLILLVAFMLLPIDRLPEFYDGNITGDPPEITFYEIGIHPQHPSRFTGIEFFEKTNYLGAEEKMWSISPLTPSKAGASIRLLSYGVPPKNWHEDAPAKRLTMLREHRIVLHLNHRTFNIILEGRKDWKTYSDSISE